MLRREYKLSVQIAKGTERKIDLCTSIDSGCKRGYKENEIVDAVIRAISPHSSLRGSVETLCDLSRRVHYMEKATPEVYQQLATVCQQNEESP